MSDFAHNQRVKYYAVAPELTLLDSKSTLLSRMESCRKKWDEIQKEMQGIHAQLKAIDEVLDGRKLEASKASGIPDWDFLLEETGNTSTFRSKACREALKGLSPLLGEYTGLYHSGYRPNLSQRALSVSLRKGNHELTLAVASAIETLLPHLKPFNLPSNPDVQGVVFDLFETHSENGGYQIEIPTDRQKFSITSGRYPFTHRKSLLELLTYIQENLYYED